MNDKLILIALILCISSSVDSLKLTNICKDDVFEYNGLKVNSFYKIRQHVRILMIIKLISMLNQKQTN